MSLLLGLLIMLAIEYVAIYIVARYGLVFSGLMIWIFPPAALVVGFLWYAMMTTHLWTAVPMIAVTFLAARSGWRSRG